MFFKRRKSRLERTRDRIQNLAESGKVEARRRTSNDASDDTEHLSFIGGLMLGLVIGVLVAVVVSNRQFQLNEMRKHQTGIQLLPHQDEGSTENNPAATG